MQKIISLLLLFTATIGFAQTNVATYKIKYLFDEETLDPRALSRLQSLTMYEDDIEVQLLFTHDKAVSILNNEFINNSNKMAFALCSCSEIRFYSVKNNIVKYNNKEETFLGIKENTYLVTDKLNDNKWKLEDESKLINNIKVYKATKEHITVDGKNEPITAWYAPEIPYPYGPKGYGGLPGLIFQVQQGIQMFTLDKILFDQNIEMPEDPTKGTIISQKEYSKMKYDKAEGL